MSVIVTFPINGRTDDLDKLSFPAPKGKLNRLPAAPAAAEQRILAVEFRSPEGGTGTRSAAARVSRRRSTGRGKAARTTRPGTWSGGTTCMATSVETGPAARGRPVGYAMTRTEARQ
jgi:hypothetical protein